MTTRTLIQSTFIVAQFYDSHAMLKPAPLIMFLNDFKDPHPRKRINGCEHKFIDILIIAICAIMSNGESWEDMESYGHDKEDWLRTFLELPYGIPSHDTFYRIFCALDPEVFEACFIRWVKSFFQEAQAQEENPTDIIPIDGKTMRGSKGKGKRAVHRVSARSSNLRLVLGQKKVDSKSNEITAIPELFEIIDMKGALITADAISWQKSIASKCIEKEAENLSILRRIRLNVFNLDKAGKGSMKRKRKRAGWNNDYLTGLLKTFMFSQNLYSNENDYPRA